MSKIEYLKYKENINEITCQCKMFCTMINQYLSIKSQFDLKNENIFDSSLLEIFEDKILSFFQFYKFKPQKSQPIVKIYKYDSLLFNQYFKQSKHPKMKYLTRNFYFNPEFKILIGYEHPCVDLIQLIFNGKEVQMMVDLNEIFINTISSRIKKEITKSGTLHPKWMSPHPFIYTNNKEKQCRR